MDGMRDAVRFTMSHIALNACIISRVDGLIIIIIIIVVIHNNNIYMQWWWWEHPDTSCTCWGRLTSAPNSQQSTNIHSHFFFYSTLIYSFCMYMYTVHTFWILSICYCFFFIFCSAPFFRYFSLPTCIFVFRPPSSSSSSHCTYTRLRPLSEVAFLENCTFHLICQMAVATICRDDDDEDHDSNRHSIHFGEQIQSAE